MVVAGEQNNCTLLNHYYKHTVAEAVVVVGILVVRSTAGSDGLIDLLLRIRSGAVAADQHTGPVADMGDDIGVVGLYRSEEDDTEV